MAARLSARSARFAGTTFAFFISAMLAIAAVTPVAAKDNSASLFGPFGPEGPRMREQLWIVPSADNHYPLRATVFRPDDDQDADDEIRRPLVVINHGTSDATRMAVAMPVYYWLSRWFVDRGYVVVLPQRRGHGATGGPMAESIGTCSNPDHFHSGLAAADDIQGVVTYMSAQSFVAAGETVVVGISSGGWASLALASRNPKDVRAIVNIAGGRGGRPFGLQSDTVCGEQNLLEAVGGFAKSARLPTLWLYAENDSYFSPALSRRMAAAWHRQGADAELHIFAPYGADGHNLADDRAGWDVWGATLAHFLDARHSSPVAALDSNAVGVTPAADTSIVPAIPASTATATAAADGETHAP